MKRTKLIRNILFIFTAILLGLVLVGIKGQFFETLKTEEPKIQPIETAKPEQNETQKQPTPQITIPDTYLLQVPYTVQAPYANWNIHEESCEEAALLMMHYYLTDQKVTVIPVATANKQLIEMVNWQIKRYGKQSDLNMTSLGELAKEYYGYQFEVKKNITAEEIKKAVAAGKPVLVPVITHGLQNPHYGRTPTYHILLIKGYDATGVITNDAGVKEGMNYHYTWQILWQAIDRQTSKMQQGRDILILSN